MAQADGSIILETGINLDGFEAGSKDLEHAARNTARNIKNISVATQASLRKQADTIAKINQQYAKQKATVDALKQSIDIAGKQNESAEEYKKLGAELDGLQMQFDKLQTQQEEWNSLGFDTDSAAFQKLDAELIEISNRMDAIIAKREEMEKAGTHSPVDTSKLARQLATEEEKLTKIHERLGESYGNLRTKATLYERRASDLSSTTSKLHNVTRSLTGGMKKLLTAMAGLNKQSKGTELTFAKMLATSLLFSGVFTALSIVINGLLTGFENLAQYSAETNASISSLISALTYLKNAFATAFAPILNVVSPLLTAFINMIARAVTYVGMFFAALTGQKTFQKAIPVQEDYAASLSDTASSAKDAADATKEAAKATSDYLSPLDEISRYETRDTSATGGNQASGSLPGYTPPSPEEMFETVSIETSISDFAAKIKALIEAQDWDGLGSLLGSKINSITQAVKDAVDWDNVGPHVTYFITALTTTFNSLVSAINWPLIGQTVGSGINTIVNTLSLLITGIDWKNLGVSFATGVNGMFNEVDWAALGMLIGQKFMISWNMFYGFVTTLDWGQVGNAIGTAVSTAITNIDPVVMAAGISAFVIGILTAIISAVIATDWTAVGQTVATMLMSVDWTGIASQLYGAGKELISGLLEAFGELPLPVQIATLSLLAFKAVLNEMAAAKTISMLTNGFSGLTTVLGRSVGESGTGLAGSVIGLTSLLSLMGVELLLLIANKDQVQAAFDDFRLWMDDVFVQDFEAAMKDNSKSSHGFADELKLALITSRKAAQDILNWIGGIFAPAFNGFFEGLYSSVEWFTSGFEDFFTGVTDFLSGIFTGNWNLAWTGLINIVKGLFQGLASIVVGPINAVIGLINGMISGLESGINSIINGINSNLTISLPDWLGGISFSPNLSNVGFPRVPSIPALATGTVIPPNASKFLAMLGDNNRETEVVSPLSTMEEAMFNALGRAGMLGGGNRMIHLTLELDRRVVYDAVIDEARLVQGDTGGNPFDL